jgi:CheY-like chemotaxis protein
MAHERILVIDDDPDLVEAMRLILESEGYEVHSASGGEEGLERVKEVDPDLILLDAMMDYATEGFQVALRLRDPQEDSDYAAYRDVPILMLTAIHDTTSLRFGPDEGYLPVDAFVEKPVEARALVTKVEEMLTGATE